jgi:hypothetical protein
MGRYLAEVVSTLQAFAAVIKNPQDRTQVIAGLLEKKGGKLLVVRQTSSGSLRHFALRW